jgi:hypothetical protein
MYDPLYFGDIKMEKIHLFNKEGIIATGRGWFEGPLKEEGKISFEVPNLDTKLRKKPDFTLTVPFLVQVKKEYYDRDKGKHAELYFHYNPDDWELSERKVDWFRYVQVKQVYVHKKFGYRFEKESERITNQEVMQFLESLKPLLKALDIRETIGEERLWENREQLKKAVKEFNEALEKVKND